MNFREVLNQTLGETTSEVLGIYQHIPPRVQYENFTFDVHVDLFKGEVQEWFDEERWKKSFNLDDIKYNYLGLTCEFFGTKYCLEIYSIYNALIRIVSPVGNSKVCIDIRKERISNRVVYTAQFKVDEDWQVIHHENIALKLKSDVKKLRCSVSLTFFEKIDGDGYSCTSNQAFYVRGRNESGIMDIKTQRPINGKELPANSKEEILREVRNTSLLYKFFSFL